MKSTTCWPSTRRARPASSRPTSRSRAAGAAILAALSALAAGCAAQPGRGLPGPAVGPAELLRAQPLVGDSPVPDVPDADILGLDQAMRAFVADNVRASAPLSHRLEQLTRAVIGTKQLGVEYDQRTYTASEAFSLRQANCLSFTNMFVALARKAGLTVSFQEVEVPPDWSRSGDVVVLNRHIDVLVKTFEARDQVVDFNMPDFRTSYERRAVSDERAAAHYYSNIAVERMQAGADPEALAYFRKAISKDPTFGAAWINLGSLYLRAGQPDWAAATWRYALRLDPGDLVAMSNLERVERQQGRVAAADRLLRRIGRHRLQNPYYRYYLAERAIEAGDYDAAIGHLTFAVRQKKNEDRFYALLGLAYLRAGDAATAERWLARAEAVAADDDLQRNYHSKLEMLRKIGDS